MTGLNIDSTDNDCSPISKRLVGYNQGLSSRIGYNIYSFGCVGVGELHPDCGLASSVG